MTDVLGEISQSSLGHIRKTSESPPRVSVYDVIGAITGKHGDDSGKAYRRLIEQFPEVRTAGPDFKFPGQGQRETPVANAREITEIIMVLSGRGAAQFRKKSADVVVRFAGSKRTRSSAACLRTLAAVCPGNNMMILLAE